MEESNTTDVAEAYMVEADKEREGYTHNGKDRWVSPNDEDGWYQLEGNKFVYKSTCLDDCFKDNR